MFSLNHTELLANPLAARKLAAELEVIICEYRAHAARARAQVATAEMIGDLVQVDKWAARAEAHDIDARDIEAQRRLLIARYLPPVMIDVTLDDCGVAA